MPQEVPPAGPPEEDQPAPTEGLAPLPGGFMHQPEEFPLTAPESRCLFQSGPNGELMMTPAALERFGVATILACFFRLQYLARLQGGLGSLQVFEDPDSRNELWFFEDAPGVVTALLPEER